jgi:HPt (histidine-containing phosphotransfer) domain-containing protein
MISQALAPLYSSLADDPDMSDLIEMYVEEVPQKIAEIERLLAEERWEDLQRAAHQLKGSAGGYGFDCLTPFASQLESSIRNWEDREIIDMQVKTLVLHLQAVQTS